MEICACVYNLARCSCFGHSVYLLSFSLKTKYRQKADSIRFTQVADDLSIKHAKKSQELQSDVSLHFKAAATYYSLRCNTLNICLTFQLAYKANTEQILHQYTITKDEPLFRQAKANADLLSAVSSQRK